MKKDELLKSISLSFEESSIKNWNIISMLLDCDNNQSKNASKEPENLISAIFKSILFLLLNDVKKWQFWLSWLKVIKLVWLLLFAFDAFPPSSSIALMSKLLSLIL